VGYLTWKVIKGRFGFRYGYHSHPFGTSFAGSHGKASITVADIVGTGSHVVSHVLRKRDQGAEHMEQVPDGKDSVKCRSDLSRQCQGPDLADVHRFDRRPHCLRSRP
jgi:hypothetical protein